MRANVTFIADHMTINVSLANVDINAAGLLVNLDDTYVAAVADEMIRSEYGIIPLKYAEDVIIEYIDDAEYDTELGGANECGECDTCGQAYDLSSRFNRCGSCGDCGKCCVHGGSNE